MPWGMYGDKGPCEHILKLRALLEEEGLEVYSEDGEEPPGWVNVHCSKCNRTYETVLRQPYEDDPDADVYRETDGDDED